MAFLLRRTRRAASTTPRLPLLALLAAFGLGGCGGGYNYVVQSMGPVTAADGTFQVTVLPGGNRQVLGNFTHLPPASRVNANLTTYVLWFRDQSGNNVKGGSLSHNEESRTATVSATTPFRNFQVFVTAERTPDVSVPSENVIFRTSVETE